MVDSIPFPPLEGWEPTRETLHLYTKAVGVIPRKHAEQAPHWRHISLKVHPDGLYTDPMDLPAGGKFQLKIDLDQHRVLLMADGRDQLAFSMTEGLTATAFGDRLLDAVADLGLSGEYQRHRFENEDVRHYDPEIVSLFWQALTNADRIFKAHRASLEGDREPVQFWTHNFDLGFVWFGTRMVTDEEGGDESGSPAQLNLGFYPGDAQDAPYFYSNPWPFDGELLLDKALPDGASWHTEGWKGTILPYAELAGKEDAEARLLHYARTVFELTSPLLLGDGPGA